MPSYAKICIVDQKKFWARRRDALYCSKECSNRTRYMPKELIESLKQRNEKYMLRANNHVAMVMDNDGITSSVGYIPEGATEENPLGNDYGLLKAQALIIKQERDNQLLRDQQEQKRIAESEDNSGFLVVEDNSENDHKTKKRKFGGGVK